MRARIVLLIAIAGVLFYAYPGLMTADSADQLIGARQWALGDWQPPVMSVLWRGVDAIWSGPFGMLLIQVIGAALGAAAILRAGMSATRAAVGALVLLWFPPVLSVVGVIWKDNQMAAFALLGIAGLLSPRPWPRRVALAALWLATAMRHNAAAATFAPVILLWRPDRLADRLGGARRWAAAAGVWAAITATAFGTNALLTRTHEHPWTRSIATTDIVGVIRWAPPLSDDELRTALAGAPLRVDHDIQRAAIAGYDPRGWNRYFQSAAPILVMPQTPDELAAIDRAWRDLVTAHPAAYLRHRWTVFAYLLKLRGSRTFVPTTSFTDQENPGMAQALGLDPRPNVIQRGLFAAIAVVPSVIYLPFLYLVLAMALLVIARRDRLVVALLASGILYELAYFIAAPSVDYRYSVWLITTTVLAAALVIQRRVQGPIGSMRIAGADTNIDARAAASGGGAGSAAGAAEPAADPAEPAAGPAEPEPDPAAAPAAG